MEWKNMTVKERIEFIDKYKDERTNEELAEMLHTIVGKIRNYLYGYHIKRNVSRPSYHRRGGEWTDSKLEKLDHVIEIMKELHKYKPLSIRQIFYQMVSKKRIKNTHNEYAALDTLITNARYEKYIDWKDIKDSSREFYDCQGYDNVTEYAEYEVQNLFDDYYRNLMQTQDKYVEIWLEKDALSEIFKRVASKYTIPIMICRGFISTTFIMDFAERRMPKDKKTVILYFSDFDPSGVYMSEIDIPNRLYNRLKISRDRVKIKRIALNKSQTDKYHLEKDPDSIKSGDTKRDWFIKKYGNIQRFRKKDEHIRSYLNCILDHVPKETAKYLTSRDYTVKFQNYNWQLNEQAKK